MTSVGLLATLATSLSVDVYGPICDNGGGIVEMSGLGSHVRDKTDALDAAGNTTAATGKGIAVLASALTSLSLLSAFIIRVTPASSTGVTISIIDKSVLAAAIVGSVVPHIFSALVMRSVGTAAYKMIEEIQREFRANPMLLVPESGARPPYDNCVAISTKASLRE